MVKLLVVIFTPGRTFPPLLSQGRSWLQCLMVFATLARLGNSIRNKRLYLPYTLWLFLLTRLFKGLMNEATMAPACHRTHLGLHLHNAKDWFQKPRQQSILEAFPPVMFDSLQTVTEEPTGPPSERHTASDDTDGRTLPRPRLAALQAASSAHTGWFTMG